MIQTVPLNEIRGRVADRPPNTLLLRAFFSGAPINVREEYLREVDQMYYPICVLKTLHTSTGTPSTA